MKRQILLLSLVVVAVLININAATHTVTNADPLGSGGFGEIYTLAESGDVIEFNVDLSSTSNTIQLAGALTMKSVTLDGMNKFNNEKIKLTQSTNGVVFFDVKAGITAGLKNIVFDGTGANKVAITAANGSILTIDHCEFKNFNTGTDNGGAARLQGTCTITNSIFKNNTCAGTYGGGALCIYNAAEISIDKCTFINNTAGTGTNANNGGGAIVVRGTVANPCNVTITNSTFANNNATKRGGAILVSVQSSNDFTANLTLINCTLVGNQGDGAVAAQTTVNGKSNLNMINCIVLHNVNAAGSAYDDIRLVRGNETTATVNIMANHIIYSTIVDSKDTPLTDCVVVSEPNAANVFHSLETFAVDFKRSTLITAADGQTYAAISENGLAKGKGAESVANFSIPEYDQLGTVRPMPPSIGAVEFTQTGTGNQINKETTYKVTSVNKQLMISGLSQPTNVQVYDLSGMLLFDNKTQTNGIIQLSTSRQQMLIVKVDNHAEKVMLR